MKVAVKTLKILNIMLLSIVSAVLIFSMFIFSFASSRDKGISLFGTKYMRVLTGSMKPTYTETDVLRVKKVSFDELKDGDVITFTGIEQGVEIHITHRIYSIDKENKSLRTSGDSAPFIDPLPVTEENYIGKVLGKSGVFTSLFSAFSSKFGFFFIVLLPCMLSAIFEVMSFLGAAFAFTDSRHSHITEKARIWNLSTVNMPLDKRKEEFRQKFGRYQKILGGDAFVFIQKTQSRAGQKEFLYKLSKRDIVVAPFSCGEFIFMSLVSAANRQVFAKQGNKKTLKTLVWKPRSNNPNDLKDVNITVVNVDVGGKFNFRRSIGNLKGIFKNKKPS